MIHINKIRPKCFDDYVSKRKPKSWEEVDHQLLRKWREYLIFTEQGGLSAYTEIPLNLDSSHIDHFYKREFGKGIFDWNNLIADSKDETFGAKFKDKQKNIDYLKLLHPVNDNPDNLFEYSPNGKIFPAKNLNQQLEEKACYTIRVFNLNADTLVNRRKTIFDAIASMMNDPNFDRLLICNCFKDYGFPSVVNQIISYLR